jgi:hypothetical protein
MSEMADLGAMLGEAFNECHERGMQLPFVACSASPNGSVLAMRVHGFGKSNELLAQHFEAEGFGLPITIMVLDQSGNAARITIGSDGKRAWH